MRHIYSDAGLADNSRSAFLTLYTRRLATREHRRSPGLAQVELLWPAVQVPRLGIRRARIEEYATPVLAQCIDAQDAIGANYLVA